MDLCRRYNNQTFRRLTTQRGTTDEDWQYEDIQIALPGEVDTPSDLRDLSQQLPTSMNEWLQYSQDPGWNQIVLNLSNQLGNNNFRLIVRATAPELYKLPWHSWNLMRLNPNLEIAFSFPTNGGLASPQTKDRNNTKVRILAVLGSNIHLDLEQDLKLLYQLNDAEVTPLPQPSAQELIRKLRRLEGWDIVYFAGHSETIGDDGRIHIKENSFLDISEFQNSLRDAISHGLKIAIFNSCEGLGIARQLACLHIPFTIVMTALVPNIVAQSFLKYFLIEYSDGRSLYTSVRRAREKLEEFQEEVPGSTSLPVIVQNPIQAPLTWQDLFLPSQVCVKPFSSRVKFNIDRRQDLLEIVIPPKGLDGSHLFALLFVFLIGFISVLCILLPIFSGPGSIA